MTDETVQVKVVSVGDTKINLLSYEKMPIADGEATELQVLEFMCLEHLWAFYLHTLGDKASYKLSAAVDRYTRFGRWGFCLRSQALIAFVVRQDEKYAENKLEILAHELDHLLRPAQSVEESELSAARTGFIVKCAFRFLDATNAQIVNKFGKDMIHVRGTI